VADANAAGDDGDVAVLAAKVMQACASAWDDHVYVVFEVEQFQDEGAVRAIDKLDGVNGDVACAESFLQGHDHGAVRV
jgi:hypothetical protein